QSAQQKATSSPSSELVTAGSTGLPVTGQSSLTGARAARCRTFSRKASGSASNLALQSAQQNATSSPSSELVTPGSTGLPVTGQSSLTGSAGASRVASIAS